MLLACCEFRLGTGSYCLECCFYRDSVLLAVLYAGNSSDRVGVTLGYALAPESIVSAVGKDAAAVKTVDREHAGIPAAGDEGCVIRAGSSLINVCKVFRDLSVCIEAVDYVEH